jgi:TolB-like protein/cytochrome c-type biogenesis protein CcmH/NrfG
MSADPENEYFGDGIAEEIINALTQIDGLRVAARTSSFSFKGKSAAIGEIAEKLKVRHVLEGSVRKAGNRVRIAAQLVEASTGYQLWSERYDRQLEDIFDVQDEIARTIVERLKIAFSVAPAGVLVKASTTNMEAYQLYLKGRASLYKRGVWIARALESFRQAVELDPGYADAWAGLADAYTTQGYYGFAPSREMLPRALDAARQAVTIDPDSAGAHSALALPALLWDRDFEMAEREFQRALAINPAYTQARCWYGLMYLQGSTTRLDEGVDEARRAVGFDPLSGYATACYAYALSQARRTSDAVIQARLAVQRDRESFIAWWALGNACQWDGRFDEAIDAYEHLLRASGRHPWPLAGLAATYAKMGKLAEARALHAELLAQRASRFVQPTMLAMSASAAGDHEAAILFCHECVDEHDVLFGIFYQHYVDLDRVRADPRFTDIVAQFNKRERMS